MLLTTSFDLSKETRTPVVIAALKNLTATYGVNSGQLDLSVTKGVGVKSVNFQYTLDTNANANSNWITVSGTDSYCTISNLPVGAIATIRVYAVGTRKQVVYSDPITKMVA